MSKHPGPGSGSEEEPPQASLAASSNSSFTPLFSFADVSKYSRAPIFFIISLAEASVTGAWGKVMLSSFFLSHQVPLGQSLLGLLVIFQIRLQSHQQFLKNRKQGYNVWNSSTLASLRLSSLDSPSQRSSTLARESGSPMLNPMRRTSVPL